MVGNFCLAYIPLEQSQKCCGCWTVQHNFKKKGAGGSNWNVLVQVQVKGIGDDDSRGWCVHNNSELCEHTLSAEIFQDSQLLVWVWSYTDLPPPALVSKQKERQLASRSLGGVGGIERWGARVGMGGGSGWEWRQEERPYLIGKAAQSLTQIKLECPQGPRGRYINADSLCKQERPWVRNIWRQLMV